MLHTDWDSYYDNMFWAAKFTRAYTTGLLLEQMKDFLGGLSHPSIVEFGGGNSSFYEAIRGKIAPSKYTIVDTNQKSLDLFNEKFADSGTCTINASVLDAPLAANAADIVFSVGLVEHFDEQGTRRAINSHFECVKPGGLVIITFPTPTWLYRAARGVTEFFNQWAFPDERPLPMGEVEDIMSPWGTVCSKKILWPLIYTQGLIAIRTSANPVS